jgi:hypothetical protein
MAQPATGGSSINRDLGHKLDVEASLSPVLVKDTATGTGLAVDLKGYEGAVIMLHYGISLDTLSGSIYVVPSIQHSADGSTGWADIAATKYRLDTCINATTLNVWTRDTTLTTAIDAAAEDDLLMKFTLVPGAGINRYVRTLFTVTGTHTNGTPASSYVVKGFSRVEAAL